MEAVLVKNANRMMTVASLLDNGIELSFADGSKGLIPFADVPDIKERSSVTSLELPNPYERVLGTASRERDEIPRNFTRHHNDASYRPTIGGIAMRSTQIVGECIRHFEESTGLRQGALTHEADIR